MLPKSKQIKHHAVANTGPISRSWADNKDNMEKAMY